MSTPITSCKNIGPTIAKNLAKVGITTREQLQKQGPVEVYNRLLRYDPHVTWPVCYYLYSLEGALTNTHWDKIGEKRKQALVNQVKPV